MKDFPYLRNMAQRAKEKMEKQELEKYGRLLTPEERKENEEAEEIIVEKAEEEARIIAWKEARLKEFPRRYVDKTFSNFTVSTKAQRDIVEHLKAGRSAVIYGGNGTGKTHLAFAAVRNQIETGKNAKYIIAFDFFNAIKNSFSNNKTDDVMERYECFDYLVIDEVDKSFGTATEFIYLYTLVNRRYNKLLPTVLITNASEKDLVSVIGCSSLSRVAGDGAIIELHGQDYRKNQRPETPRI